MGIMGNDFNQIMSSKTAEELIKITRISRDDYQPEALKAADSELAKREIPDQEIEDIIKRIIEAEGKAIEIENSTVGSGIRFLNFLIDSFIWLIAVFVLTLPLNAHRGSQMLIGYLITLASYILYYAGLEIKFQKTLGKMITKTKVVTNNGEAPSNTDIIIRTLLRIIAPFDIVSFLFTKNGFHDRLSGTKVVKG